MQEDKPQPDTRLTADKIAKDFKAGDIILRRGDSWLSGFIAMALPNSYKISHGGILVYYDDKWQVIHSISGQISQRDGIRMEAVESFLHSAKDGVALQISPRFETDRMQLQKRALHYWEMKTPFDSDYDLNTRDKMYCTELIRAVYLDAGIEDIFGYQKVADKEIVDFSGFFYENHWEVKPLFEAE